MTYTTTAPPRRRATSTAAPDRRPLPEWINLEAVMDTDMQAELEVAADEVEALEEAVAAVARRSFRVLTRYAIASGDQHLPDEVHELIHKRTPLRDLRDALASLIGHLVTAFGEDPKAVGGTWPEWIREECEGFGQVPYWLEKYLDDDGAPREEA